jgi:hypothetical protein
VCNLGCQGVAAVLEFLQYSSCHLQDACAVASHSNHLVTKTYSPYQIVLQNVFITSFLNHVLASDCIARSTALLIKSFTFHLPSTACSRPINEVTSVTHKDSDQSHEDLGIPFFADHIRARIESFDSKLADKGEPLSSTTWKVFLPNKGWMKSRRRKEMPSRQAEAVPQKTAKTAQRVIYYSATPLSLSVLFFSCKANARV